MEVETCRMSHVACRMSELIHQFGIEWKILVAQIVNFFILLVILKKFAYGPILNILKERRKKIEEGLLAAEESQKKLGEAEKEKEGILTDARKESIGIIQKSEVTAREKESQILTEAGKKAEGIFVEEKAKIHEEKLKMKEDIYKEFSVFLKEALAKIVEKSPQDLDDNLIQETLRELKEM
ncbi:MAG: ATP synthase subunit b [Parcubacteria group bacterium GW2011_GWA2_42_14]|nr:MAG: ATP synthase subunit b [Parcubacteria group bacterium GW2011_GWA2_42_14]